MTSNSLKYDHTCNRILEAISMDKDLNVANNLRWPCSICNKNVTANMKYNVIPVINGVTLNVKVLALKNMK